MVACVGRAVLTILQSRTHTIVIFHDPQAPPHAGETSQQAHSDSARKSAADSNSQFARPVAVDPGSDAVLISSTVHNESIDRLHHGHIGSSPSGTYSQRRLLAAIRDAGACDVQARTQAQKLTPRTCQENCFQIRPWPENCSHERFRWLLQICVATAPSQRPRFLICESSRRKFVCSIIIGARVQCPVSATVECCEIRHLR
jgi:hypothetical protein